MSERKDISPKVDGVAPYDGPAGGWSALRADRDFFAAHDPASGTPAYNAIPAPLQRAA